MYFPFCMFMRPPISLSVHFDCPFRVDSLFSAGFLSSPVRSIRFPVYMPYFCLFRKLQPFPVHCYPLKGCNISLNHEISSGRPFTTALFMLSRRIEALSPQCFPSMLFCFCSFNIRLLPQYLSRFVLTNDLYISKKNSPQCSKYTSSPYTFPDFRHTSRFFSVSPPI